MRRMTVARGRGEEINASTKLFPAGSLGMGTSIYKKREKWKTSKQTEITRSKGCNQHQKEREGKPVSQRLAQKAKGGGSTHKQARSSSSLHQVGKKKGTSRPCRLSNHLAALSHRSRSVVEFGVPVPECRIPRTGIYHCPARGQRNQIYGWSCCPKKVRGRWALAKRKVSVKRQWFVFTLPSCLRSQNHGQQTKNK